MHDAFSSVRTLQVHGKTYNYYSLAAFSQTTGIDVRRLPVSLRIVLESCIRSCDGVRVRADDVREVAKWNTQAEAPFVVARIILQDFTGVPLLVDLAAMRDAAAAEGQNPACIEPLVPVDLVVDHSVQVDYAGSPDAFKRNLAKEFERNGERYAFLKWGQNAFKTLNVVPPGLGIVHQVNLEYLASVVFEKTEDGHTWLYPDTLVGTDSHTTMINGLGIVGWGVGGIEAEAGMLGQPIYFQVPEVIGVYLSGTLPEGITATDLTLTLTHRLRAAKVVGKFVEFFGPGTRNLTVADRATIANMAPEYGATMGFFPVDEATLTYLRDTGRSAELCERIRAYYLAQNLWGTPDKGDIDYTQVIELDLSTLQPTIAGPKRPQDTVTLSGIRDTISPATAVDAATSIQNGSVVIAAITSCTNTSNPSVMIAAGLLAKRAVELGLQVPKYVKTSLAPGSRVVTDYLTATGLQTYLDALGFHLVGYGCTTCIGNSGPLAPEIDAAIKAHSLTVASVLSGNRNFEARVHEHVKANFLMSPPLVVAFALAGTVSIDLITEPLGIAKDGKPVYLKDLWPTNQDIQAALAQVRPELFQKRYAHIACDNPEWNAIPASAHQLYNWDSASTYIQQPPFFKQFTPTPKPVASLQNMRPLLVVGNSVTTDHISPAGSILPQGPAGEYLKSCGVQLKDFNSFGSRRGNDRVMTRGTFANVRLQNLIAPGTEGGYTRCMPEGTLMSIYDAAQTYAQRGIPLIAFAGEDYGMGSSRDWAAKGSALLGIRVVVAASFERIHRSNLIGMGILPLQFMPGENTTTYCLTGAETFSINELSDTLAPGSKIILEINYPDATIHKTPLIVRIDTPIELEYYRHGGILPYVLRQILHSTL